LKNLYKNFYFKIIYLFILGVFSSFSLPPYNFFLINFFTISLFFIFLIKEKENFKKQSIYFVFGWIFGFGYFLSSLYWISYALTFDEVFKFLIPFGLILIPSFLGIFYGMGSYFFSFFLKKDNISLLLIFSSIFGCIEFIRGNILTGFPWNLFVFSFSKNTEFLQILSFTGTYGLNLICISFFLIPAIFILRKSRKEIFFCLFLILLSSFFFIYGNQKLNDKNIIIKKDNDFTIKLVSPKIDIEMFYDNNSEVKIIKNLINLSEPNPDISTIFIWPEGALSPLNLKDIKLYKRLFQKNFSEKHLIVLGINDFNFSDKNIKHYNSLAVVDRDLKIKAIYYKNNLVPFGEFLPFEKYLSNLGLKTISYGYESYSSGEKRNIIKLQNENFNLNFLPLICYEIIYSGKLSKRKNFEIIINISEDGWFGNSIGPYQHFTHSIFRAIEEGKDIIRVSNNGITAHIGNNGLIISELKSTQSGVIEIVNFNEEKQTFFSQNGNKIFFYLLIIYISLFFFINKKGSK